MQYAVYQNSVLFFALMSTLNVMLIITYFYVLIG
jgi:hypothetical protein